MNALQDIRMYFLFSYIRNDFNFNHSVLRKLADFYARTSRKGLLEIFAIYFVDSAKEVHVIDIDCRLYEQR